MKNILVPTDFSVHAEKAFAVASSFAKSLGYGITLFTSLTPQLKRLLVYAAGVSKYSEVEGQQEELVAYVNEKLADLASEDVFKGVPVSFKVLPMNDNDSASHIVGALNSREYAMVVMGNEGSIGQRLKQKDDEKDLTQEEIWKNKYA
mgnify:CR=1 FL=1